VGVFASFCLSKKIAFWGKKMMILLVKYSKKVIFGINNNVGKRVILDVRSTKETTKEIESGCPL